LPTTALEDVVGRHHPTTLCTLDVPAITVPYGGDMYYDRVHRERVHRKRFGKGTIRVIL
jgi:hypothetical protein